MYNINLRLLNLQKEKEACFPPDEAPSLWRIVLVWYSGTLGNDSNEGNKGDRKGGAQGKDLEFERGQRANRFSGFNPVVFLLFSGE